MFSQKDRRILRDLARRKAELAAQPVQQERRRLWTRLNRLQAERPMVWIFEIPWHEMNAGEELTLRCEGERARPIETALRRELYHAAHMPDDLLIEPFFPVGPVLTDTGFGIAEEVDIAQTDAVSDVVSRHFHIQIQDEADIEKIQMPTVALDAPAWDREQGLLGELFDGVLPAVKTGLRHTSIAPWDFLVRLTGVDALMIDLIERPAYVHKLIDRMTRAHLHRLDQYEQLNLLALNNDTYSGGGYQCTDELPRPGWDPAHVRPADLWGRTMSQIFSSVSPAMHEEFALQYEARYLNRFGLTYYGCCEPLDRKVGILRKHVPSLRKISMSPWINLDTAIAAVGADYVFSLKPNPAVLAADPWQPDAVRRDLEQTLARLKGLQVEIVMKDISTVRYEPQRLWEWARLAAEAAAAAA